MKRKLLTLALCTINLISYAQLQMGDWLVHFAYNDILTVEQSTDYVYAVSNGLLIAVDKNDDEVIQYNRFTGLNGNNICQIKYDNARNQLVILYEDGNIDLLRTDKTFNISDWQQKQMTSSKKTNDIAINGKYAYLATDFGVVVLNLVKKEIADVCYIGNQASEVRLISIAIAGDSIYAVSDKNELYSAKTTDNIIDFNNWKTLTNLPGSGTIKQVIGFDNYVCLLRNQRLHSRKQATTKWIWRATETTFVKLRQENNKLYALGPKGTYIFEKDFNDTEILDLWNSSSDMLYDAINRTYWYAAGTDGLKRFDAANETYDQFKINGPTVNTPYKINIFGSKVYVVPGGYGASQFLTPAVVMIYENKLWTNIINSDINNKAQYNVYDFTHIAQDPKDSNHFFASSYGCGVLEFRNNELVKTYLPDNSSLTSLSSNPERAIAYTRTTGVTFDSKGYLWVLNTGAASFNINNMSPNGQWTGLHIKDKNGVKLDDFNTLEEILFDKRNENYKWITSLRSSTGLALFYDGGTPQDATDDYAVFRTNFTDQDGNNLTPSYIYSAAQDLDNDLWVGTENGLFIIPSSSDFMKSDACQRVKIPRNDGTNLADYLLDSEQVRAIAVDGANRKWIGTNSSGLYLVSPNGQETIKHFTTENSPLLSNYIMSIAINNETGEVFVGTDQGLVSYQSDATAGHTDFEDVYAYPNPVTEDYSGVITMSGLMTNTIVKIIDIAGNLVCETRSNGGLAIWDGKDSNGRRVNTGIYIVQCVTPNGEHRTVTKILVTR